MTFFTDQNGLQQTNNSVEYKEECTMYFMCQRYSALADKRGTMYDFLKQHLKSSNSPVSLMVCSVYIFYTCLYRVWYYI